MYNKFIPPVLISLILGAGILGGCSKSDISNSSNSANSPGISSVDFLKSNDSISESLDSLVVIIKLNDLSSTNGQISVKLSGDAVYGEQYTTKPVAVNGIVTLPVPKDMASVQFTVFRTVLPQTDKTIIMTLINPTDGYKLGERISSSVKINMKPFSTVEFSDNAVDVLDSQSGVIVNLYVLGVPLTKSEDVSIEIIQPDGIAYGTNYYTDPAAVQNQLKITAVPGNVNLSFKVIPIGNSTSTGYNITFRLSQLGQDLHKGKITETTVWVLKATPVNYN
jgi:hypothetical protein